MPLIVFFGIIYVIIAWALIGASFSLALGVAYGIAYLFSLLPPQYQTRLLDFIIPINDYMEGVYNDIIGYITSIKLVQQYPDEILLARVLLIYYFVKRKFSNKKMLLIMGETFFKKYRKFLTAYFVVFYLTGIVLMIMIEKMDNLLYIIIVGFCALSLLFLFVKNFITIAVSAYYDIKELIVGSYLLTKAYILRCINRFKRWLYGLLKGAWVRIVGKIRHIKEL